MMKPDIPRDFAGILLLLVTAVTAASEDAFRDANVIHTGDIYFAGMCPFIDTHSGGSTEGTLSAIEQVLALCNDTTVLIPGHGPVSDKKA